MATFQHFNTSDGTDLGFIIGSPLCGSPINIKVTSLNISTSSADILSFHRIIVDVKAGIDMEGHDFIEQQFSTSVENNETVEFNISSALRTLVDEYEYSPYPLTTYPRIKFQVAAYDVYMLNGITQTSPKTYLPAENDFYYALFGKYSDMERMLAGYIKRVKTFSHKPKTSTEIICVGEEYIFTPDFNGTETTPATGNFNGYSFNDLPRGPQSSTLTPSSTGMITINNRQVYVLPAASRNSDRYEFRFFNSLGVLESYSLTSLRETTTEIESKSYSLAKQEDFANFSHNIVSKYNDTDTFKLSAGPFDIDWADWFVHEFLMARYIWINLYTLTGTEMWVRCNIDIDQKVKSLNRKKEDAIEIDFTVKLDMNGSFNKNINI